MNARVRDRWERPGRRGTLPGLLALLGACSMEAPQLFEHPPQPADLSSKPPEDGLAEVPPDMSRAERPMYLTAAFDGGRAPFRTWVSTLEFARELHRTFGKRLRISYFITTAHYDPRVMGSVVGRAQSRDEAIVRMALTQQAINEGHEIANHTVRHRDGALWTEAEWLAELREFQALADRNLFEPVLDDEGEPVFPRWQAAPAAAPGQVGAGCADDTACAAGLSCARVSRKQGFCTTECNRDRPCANGTLCGWPSESGAEKDICLPRPALPVTFRGQVLFREDGTPNLAHPALRPYVSIGFRAPFLSRTAAMYEALRALGYAYDTSHVLSPRPPLLASGMYQFPLMRFEGTLAIPMDYNYLIRMGPDGKPTDPDGKIMEEDFSRSIVAAYAMDRMPWNVGYHLTPYNGGAYLETFKRVFRFAARGCPDEAGRPRCEHVELASFRELAGHLDRGELRTARALPAQARSAVDGRDIDGCARR